MTKSKPTYVAIVYYCYDRLPGIHGILGVTHSTNSGKVAAELGLLLLERFERRKSVQSYIKAMKRTGTLATELHLEFSIHSQLLA
jgi:hypothetical protein